MIIFEVIPSFEPLGGAENFVFHLSQRLKKEHEVIVVSFYSRENKYVSKILKENNIKIFYLNKKQGVDLKASRVFKKIYRMYKPDVVHLHLNSIITCLPVILKRKSLFLYTFHTYISTQTYGNKNKLVNRLHRYLFRHEYLFPITISDTVDQSFKEYFGKYKSKIIYNGIDIERFNYRPDILKTITFISVGSFSDIKNNLFMIKCVEEMIKKGFDINYTVLGQGKNFELCRDYLLKHNLVNRIKLVGAVNNVEEYLSKSSCLLLASHWEGNPLVVNEAIASGVWVIANNVGGLKDLINDTNGYLVRPEDAVDFVDKMQLFIKNKESIFNEIIPANIETNRQKVDLARTTKNYLNLMNDLNKTNLRKTK